MNIYSQQQVDQAQDSDYHFIIVQQDEHVLEITLNRPKRKNALHPQMLNEIAFAMQSAYYDHKIWMVVIRAVGDVFCAGADLKAMAGMGEAHSSQIPEPTNSFLINDLFTQIHKPVIAVIDGDVYAGGLMFLAGANVVVARDTVKLGLPEVKRGIYPMQVMAALLQVMPSKKVIDWCIRGYTLSAGEAERYGLITKAVPSEQLEEEVRAVIEELKENAPRAIQLGLEAFHHIRPSRDEHEYLVQMLGKALMSEDGQEGLRAFREKRKPKWTGQ